MTDERDVEEMSFEEAMKELEGLVKVLEKGEMDLESGLRTYERAVVLKRRCDRILKECERKVQCIMEDG